MSTTLTASSVSLFEVMRRLLVLSMDVIGAASAPRLRAHGGGGRGLGGGGADGEEKRALYAYIQSFIGNGWNRKVLFPNPCRQTPIRFVSVGAPFFSLQELRFFIPG